LTQSGKPSICSNATSFAGSQRVGSYPVNYHLVDDIHTVRVAAVHGAEVDQLAALRPPTLAGRRQQKEPVDRPLTRIDHLDLLHFGR